MEEEEQILLPVEGLLKLRWKLPEDAARKVTRGGKVLRKLKSSTLSLLKRETKRFRKKTNIEIEQLEMRLSALHDQTAAAPKASREDKLKRDALKEALREKRSALEPPSARASLRKVRQEETCPPSV